MLLPDSTRNSSSSMRDNILVFLLLSAVIFLLYSNTLHSPFTFDDTQIVDNYFIQISDLSLDSLRQISTLSPNRNRILPNISFALNYYSGGYNVFGFHLVNIFLHIATAFAFFLLARTTLMLCPAARRPGRINEIALAAALIWAVHPLQTSGVTYIVQRMTSMAALFFLLALLFYVKARLSTVLKKKALHSGLFLICGTMALLSKENSSMLPLVILGYELSFLGQSGNGNAGRKKILLAGGLCFLLFLLIAWFFLGSDPLTRILQGYGAREFTLGQRLLTESRIIIHYLALLFLPLPSRLNLAYDFPLSSGLLAPVQTLLALSGLMGLLALTAFSCRRNRLVFFAFFWFLANLFIESTIIPLELIFEHRMYLPSMFLILAAAAWGYGLPQPGPMAARLACISLGLLLALFTWQRNVTWQTEMGLWSDVVNKSPGLARGYVNLGKAYGAEGDHVKAEHLLRQAIALAPDDGHAYLGLGAALENQDRDVEALEFYNRALELRGADKASLHRNLARLYLKLKSPGQAVTHAAIARKISPYNYDSNVLLGTAYFKAGRYKEAEDALLQAIRLFPQRGDLMVQLGVVYENQNRLEEAVMVLQKALASKDVNLAQAYNTLGIAHWRLKNYQLSVDAAKQAIAADPKLLDAYLTLAITYEDMGLQEQALEQFTRGWQQGLDITALFNDWALNFMRANQPEKAIYYLQQAIKMEPGRPESHENLASAYQAQNLPGQAEKERQRARSLRHR